MTNFTISFTEEQHAFARALVETGRYSSVSEVVQHGIDLLRRQMEAEESETAALRELLSLRRKGEFMGARVMDKRLTRMIAEERRMHGPRH